MSIPLIGDGKRFVDYNKLVMQ